MFFNNKFNTFFGLNLTLVYTFPMCMAWRFQFPIRNYDFNTKMKNLELIKAELGTNCWDFANILYQVNHDQTGNDNNGYVFRDIRENKRIRRLDGAKRVKKRRMNYLREN